MFTAPVAAITDLEVAIEDYIYDEQVTRETLEETLEEIIPNVTPITSQEPTRPWTGEGFTKEELTVLNFFQDYGITDKAALAVLMGNIKQESKFVTNVCEGGHRGPYHTCRRGGFGLIQWTTVGRYSGLGRHANAIGASPTDLNTQLSYLVTEVEWKKVEHIFRTEGRGVASYMRAAYRWLGWGVEGKRTAYAWDYYNRLSLQ